jgi:hypothetical protein
MNHSDTLKVGSWQVTAGSLTSEGAIANQDREESVTLTSTDDSTSTSYAGASLVGQSWVGNGSGVAVLSGQKITLSSGGPVTGTVTLSVPFQASWLLTPPANLVDLLDDDGNYQITCFFFMEKA